MRKARFEKIVEQFKDWIFNFALYYSGNRPDAEDITQEVFIKAWQNLDKIQKKMTKAWLMRVAHNLCIDYARRRKSSAKVLQFTDMDFLDYKTVTATTSSNPENEVMSNELTEQLYRALQALPEQLRSVLMMREINDMKYADISKALEIPLNSVKVYIHRGRAELRKSISPLLAERNGNKK